MFALGFNRRFPATFHEQTVWMNQRPLKIKWSENAERAFSALTSPLYVELQLYFSCLVKKQLVFHQSAPDKFFQEVHEKLFLRFSPVTSMACSAEQGKNGQPTLPLETESVQKMMPTSLRLDFHHDKWRGEYFFK